MRSPWVTGGSISNINGLIQANPAANLFLINPNGIIFGPNARLNIGGSFVGSTANSLKFADGTVFSAKTPQTTPLLTVSVPIGLQYGQSAAGITQPSIAVNNSSGVGLEILPGKTLGLVGGNVTLNGGILTAAGGRVELGGLTGAGTVGLNSDGNNLSLSYPQGVQRGDVSLSNGAVFFSNGAVFLPVSVVDVRARGGGSIAINARNLDISNGSFLLAGIIQGLGSVDSQAGDIDLRAQGQINIANSSIFNNVESGAAGNAGNININTGKLSVTDGAQLNTDLSGQGQAGNIFINAPEQVSFDGGFAFSRLVKGGMGRGGNISITTGNLLLTGITSQGNTGQVTTATFGNGNAGDVIVNASNGVVTLDGRGSDIFSLVAQDKGIGNAGNIIIINSNSLEVKNGARIVSRTESQGNAGNVMITASGSVAFEGASNFGSGGVLSDVGSGARGNGGNVNLTAKSSLSLTNGAQINAGTSGTSNAGISGAMNKGGDVNVTTGSLSLNRGAQIITSTSGTGDAGKVVVQANGPVLLTGSGTQVSSSVNSTGMGNAGEAFITAKSLSLTDGAQLRSSTSGSGDAGRVRVQTDGDVSLKGNQTSILTAVGSGAKGNGGSIDINSTAGLLSLTNGARLQADTFGQGNAGNVTIAARDIAFDGGGSNGLSSGAFSTVNPRAMGKGGDFKVTTGSLSLTNGAQINTSTSGTGDAGKVVVQANGPVLLTGSGTQVSSSVNSTGMGNAGEAFITAKSLSLTDGAQLRSSTSGTGNAGRVRVQTDGDVSLKGNQTSILTAVGSGAKGNGGSIDINSTAGLLSLTNGARLQADTFGQGNAGNVTIAARDIAFDGVGSNGLSSGAFSTVNPKAMGNGGDFNITTGSLSLTRGAQINTSTSGRGDDRNAGRSNAGNVNIDVSDSIKLDGVNGGSSSSIFSALNQGVVGKGGDIKLTAGGLLSLTNGALINTSTSGTGNAGTVSVQTNGDVSLKGNPNGGFNINQTRIFTTVESGAKGNGGSIDINSKAGSVSLTNGALLQADTSGKGDAGNVTIAARDKISFDGVSSNGSPSGASSAVNGSGVGKGGDFKATAKSFSLTNGAELEFSTFGTGNAGTVAVQTDGDISLKGNGTAIFSTVEAEATGKGGSLDINSKAGSVFLTNGARLRADTFGKGDAGNVRITARDSVSVDGMGSDENTTGVRSSVNAGAMGKGGDIEIHGRSLLVSNGAQINAVVSRQQGNIPGGKGSGGNISVTAPDSVTLSGTDSNRNSGTFGSSSGLLALSERGASGPAGNITVTTDKFQVADSAIVAAGSFNAGGNGGDITINANNFEAFSGGQVLTNTRSSGNAGSIRLNVKDQITLSGSDSNFETRRNQVAEQLRSPGSPVQVDDFVINEPYPTSPSNVGSPSGLFATTGNGSKGAGGSIFIDPNQLNITNGAGVAVNSQGTGSAGKLQVQANSLTLNNRAFLSATANSAEGGNIELTVPSLLLMRRNSNISASASNNISASAGNGSGGGNGGNITINTPFLVAVPSENSDITANGSGNGGNVRINKNFGVYGIQSRKTRLFRT